MAKATSSKRFEQRLSDVWHRLWFTADWSSDVPQATMHAMAAYKQEEKKIEEVKRLTIGGAYRQAPPKVKHPSLLAAHGI